MYCYEAVAEALRSLEVRQLFGLMGDGNLRIVSCAVERHGIEFVGARHETSAVSMACGSAQTGGEVGFCTVTQGPGVSNAVTGLLGAVRARAPVVLLAPEVGPGDLQYFAQHDALAVAETPFVHVDEGTSPFDAVVEAYQRARSSASPVAVCLPTELQEVRVPPPRDVASLLGDGERVGAVGSGALRAALDHLGSARRPVVVAGRGAVLAGARRELEELADVTGALLATTVQAKGFFAGHRYDLGVMGSLGTTIGSELIAEADAIVAFGASLNPWTTESGTLVAPEATVIHCDADPEAIGRHTRATVALHGDARQVARGLLEAAGRTERSDGYRPVFERRGGPVEPVEGRGSFDDASTEAAIDPRALMCALEERLPAERIVVTDGGHFCGFPVQYLSVPDEASFVFGVHFGAVGLGMGAAIGAASGGEGRLVVALVGDGGLLMTLGELETLVRSELPVLVVVLDDAAYGAEMHQLRALGQPTVGSVFGDVDFAAVARALGAQGWVVRAEDDLDRLDGWLEERSGPLVLDSKVSREVRAGWHARAFPERPLPRSSPSGTAPSTGSA